MAAVVDFNKLDKQRTKEWEKTQRQREKRYFIQRGMKAAQGYKEEDEDRKKVDKVRIWTVVELYKNHVLMQTAAGIRQCFKYPDEQDMITAYKAM